MPERIEALWEPWEGHGIERLRLSVSEGGVLAESDVLDPAGTRIRYQVRADGGWATRHVEVTITGDERPRTLRLHADGAGGWQDADGNALPALEGCLDVDLGFSPFTNTLAIRRLALVAGEQAEFRVALVSAPELDVVAHPQRYVCLAPRERFRFESLDADFTRELPVDEHELVLDYPGLFRRVVPRAAG